MAGSVERQARTKARRVREQCAIALDVPLPDVLALAEIQLDLPVAIFERLGADVAGAYLSRGPRRIVLLNGSDHVTRLRFTLAHELAHHCFGDDARPDTHAGLARPGHWIEVRANAFAAELLMPPDAVAAWAGDRDVRSAGLDDVVDAALAFGVSPIVACYRLEAARLAPHGPRLQQEIARGLHRLVARERAPHADSLLEAAEQLPYVPARLRGSILFQAAMGWLSVAEAARRLGVGESFLREAWAPLGLLPPA